MSHGMPPTLIVKLKANAYLRLQNGNMSHKRQPLASMAAKKKGYNQTILDWYTKSATMPLKRVAQSPANYWGVYDMHGLIWEWTQDFNSNLVSGESRADSTLNQTMFCGSGAAGAPDPSDYAAFMRYGFRSSLQSQFALKKLGISLCKRLKNQPRLDKRPAKLHKTNQLVTIN